MGVYMLKHENDNVAIMLIDSSISRIDISKRNSHLLPIGVFTVEHLRDWINARGVPITRDNIKRDMMLMHRTNPFKYMLDNCGLSLTDHYWICERSENYSWEDINLYTNNFKSAYSLDLNEDKRSIAGKTNFIPSASLKGDLRKKWIIDQNGIRRLVKGNYNHTCRQSICEVLATEIYRKQGVVPYTPYSLIKISSECQGIIGCECPNFTSINTEFVPAIDIIDKLKKPNNMSYYEFFIEVCKKNGLDIRWFLEYQIMTDFIISNTDRHLNNFGILRDSKSLRWLSPAPIFDSGNSMFYKNSYIPVDKGLLDIQVTSFLSKEVQLLRYVTNRGLVDISKLPDDNYLYSLLSRDNNIKDEVNERLVRAYNRKIKYFSDFQNGANIWSYNYKG